MPDFQALMKASLWLAFAVTAGVKQSEESFLSYLLRVCSVFRIFSVDMPRGEV